MSAEQTEERDDMQGSEDARGRTLRILQITDTHICAEGERLAGVDTPATCDAVLDRVRGEAANADLLLMTGDLVHDHGGDLGPLYRHIRERLTGLGLPGLVVPGNHDHARVLREHFSDGPIRFRDGLAFGDWLFAMLDSSVPGAVGGHLDDGDLERLDALLGEHPERHALVCLHHHPVPVGSDWIDTIGVDNGEALFRVLRRHPNVRGVVFGHIHQEVDREADGLRLLASPSTCIQFLPRSPEFSLDPKPPGYRWLELEPDGTIRTRVERLEHVPEGLETELAGY